MSWTNSWKDPPNFLLVPSAASPKYPTRQWSFRVRRLPNHENENDERVLRQPVWILFGSSDCCEGSVRMDDERWNLHQPGSARASGCRKYLHVTEIGAFETTSTNTFRMWKSLLKKYCCSKRVIYCCGSVLTSRKTTDICWLKQHRPNLPTGTICICKNPQRCWSPLGLGSPMFCISSNIAMANVGLLPARVGLPIHSSGPRPSMTNTKLNGHGYPNKRKYSYWMISRLNGCLCLSITLFPKVDKMEYHNCRYWQSAVNNLNRKTTVKTTSQHQTPWS